MKYGIGGFTSTEECDKAIEIISRRKNIDPGEFQRGIDNLFDSKEEAVEILRELLQTQGLGAKCCWHVYEPGQGLK